MPDETGVIRDTFFDSVRFFIEEEDDIETLRTAFFYFVDSLDERIERANRDKSMRRLLSLMYGQAAEMEAKIEAELRGQ